MEKQQNTNLKMIGLTRKGSNSWTTNNTEGEHQMDNDETSNKIWILLTLFLQVIYFVKIII